jgi:hypothetical protein
MAHPVTNLDGGSPRTDSDPVFDDIEIPKRPAPTPEQARLGIMPAAIGNGTFSDVMAWVRSAPHFDGTDEEFEEFEHAIAENRAMRRQLAQERDL